MLQYPTEIQPGMTLPTLGTLQPQQFEMGGVLPRSYQIVEVEVYPVSSAREKDMNELQQQRMAGVDPKTSYFSFANTSSNPTNYTWSTTPMKNLNLSKNTVPYKFDGGSWTNQNPSRSEYRTNMGREIIDKNTALRSIRLY